MIKAEFDFFLHVPCSAHTVQIVVKDILSLNTLNEWRGKINGLISLCISNKGLRIELKKLQKFLWPEKNPLCLIRPTETRWASRFKAYERIYLLRDVFTQNLLSSKYPELKQFIKNKDIWIHLDKLLEFLKFFKDVTDLLQKTLLGSIWFFCLLKS